MKAKPHVSYNSGQNEWYTPSRFIESARQVMGGIDVDPASSEIANRTVRAEKFFTFKDNGLKQVWGEKVWLNPPYSQPLISEFSKVLVSKVETGEVQTACVLVNNATETEWFQRILKASSAVCFVTKRIKFLNKHNQPTGAPLQGQAVLYIGKHPDLFRRFFVEHGVILYKP